MPSAPTADFVRCFYEDCVPPEVKRVAFASLEGSIGEERVRAAAEDMEVPRLYEEPRLPARGPAHGPNSPRGEEGNDVYGC